MESHVVSCFYSSLNKQIYLFYFFQQKTSIQCIQQSTSSQNYLSIPVSSTRMEPAPNENALSYPQYLSTVRSQIAYAKDIHDTLICAAQNISPSE